MLLIVLYVIFLIAFLYHKYLIGPLTPHQIKSLTGVKLELAREFFKRYPESYLNKKELELMYSDYLIKNRIKEKIIKQKEAINSISSDENQKIGDNA